MNAYIFLKLLEDVSLLNPNIFLWLKRFPYPQTNYLQKVTTQEKKNLPCQIHYKVQKHLRLYNSHNMVPQIKSQEETQQWNWFLEPAVSLSKCDEKANIQVFIMWIMFSQSVFPETTLLISLVTSLSLFPFISFVISLPLLFHFFILSFYFYFALIHLMFLHVPLPLLKLMRLT